MEKARKYLEKKNPDYWDLRKEKRKQKYIKSENGEIEEIEELTDKGTGVKTLKDGSIGFSYTEKEKKLIETCEKSYSTARALEDQGVELSDEESYQDEYKIKAKEPGTEELVKIAKDTDKFTDDKIQYSSVRLITNKPLTRFLNSEGSDITQKIPYGSLYVSLKGKKGSSKADVSSSRPLMNLKRENIWEKAQSAKKEVLKKFKALLKANRIKQKKTTIIIDNDMTGLFAHEAMGHALEADQENSYLSGKKGERIGPRNLDLVSDPTRKGTRGFYKYDDEGIRGRKVKLVEKGILKSFMHSRKTAGKKGVKSTGNGRAENYSYPQIVRMNNTIITAGDTDAEEMLEETERGIYVKGFKSGNVNPSTGEFRFRSHLGYKIEDGEKKEPVKSIMLGGKILELLDKIKGIGEDFRINEDSGTCGKDGQRKRVSSGAPHVKLKNFMVS